MCPACLATAAWVVAGTTSAGGLTALVVKKLRGRDASRPAEPLPPDPNRTPPPVAEGKP